jgi:cyclopropane-fatty-acyl-phospholipid synthase
MAQQASIAHDPAVTKVGAILSEVLRDFYPREFAVEFWDGSRWEPDPGKFCRFTWQIKTPGALRAMVRSDRQVALSEGYIHDEYDISGDILAVFPVAEYLAEKHFSTAEKLRLGSLLLRLPGHSNAADPASRVHGRVHSKKRDQRAVSFHYDLSNDFYKLWLDQKLVYSCAYFTNREDSLEEAQVRKLDYICRKLRLMPGERLLDIGCGWGGLIMHAAQRYQVRAVGITLSEQQKALAEERLKEAGLSGRCEVRLLDYRDAAQLGEFDKLVSVGMIEHVGESRQAEYFRCAYQMLKPGGVFLNHGIARAGSRAKPSEPTFTDVYVFPDADLIPISTTLRNAEEAGFEIRDVENLREHYYLTLCQWLRRLEGHAERVRELVGELKYRIWRLYLAGSAHYFQSGKLGLYQALLTKNDHGQWPGPLTRSDWYR